MTDTEIILSAIPHGDILASDLTIRKVEAPKLEKDAILVRALYLSVDPYLRPKMELAKSYTKRYEIGETLYGEGIGLVTATNNEKFKEGDLVKTESLFWKEIAKYTAEDIEKLNLRVLDTKGLPLEEALYTLGISGMAAFIGMQMLGQPRRGSNVLISGAAGAVGSLAGQIAKLRGCKVYGLAGSQEKCEVLEREFGFDKALNYKEGDLQKKLEEAFPEGIDFFWDNVGGKVLDAALCNMTDFGKIYCCGATAAYNKPESIQNYFYITMKRLDVRGFITTDHREKFEQAQQEIAQWYKEGKIKTKIRVVEGIDHVFNALQGVFSGDNIGKVLVRVSALGPGPAR